MQLSSRRCFHTVGPLLQKLLVFFIFCVVDIAKLHAIDVVFRLLEHFKRSFHRVFFYGPKNSMRGAKFINAKNLKKSKSHADDGSPYLNFVPKILVCIFLIFYTQRSFQNDIILVFWLIGSKVKLKKKS
jgi:hypothetical protein